MKQRTKAIKEGDFKAFVKVVKSATGSDGAIDLEAILEAKAKNPFLIPYLEIDESKVNHAALLQQVKKLVRAIGDEAGNQSYTYDWSSKQYFEREKIFDSVESYLDSRLASSIKQAISNSNHRTGVKQALETLLVSVG